MALLTHGYWQRRFGGARDIVGQTIAFNGRSAEVVGILPQGVAFPDDDIDVWVPLALDPANPGGRSAHGLLAVGRLAPGGSVEAAMAELAPLMASWKQEWPKVYTGHFLFVRSLLEDRVGPVRPILTLLFAATGFLLLIVCANVGGIVLARGATRARELAVRSALGASRPRLVRIVLAESLLLAAAGGLAGVGLAWAGLRLLRVLDAGSLPRAHEVALDPTVLAFAAGTALLSAFVFGVVPAWRTSRVRVQDTLRSDGRTASASRGHRRFHRALVGFEVALGVVLVVGAGLVARSLVRLTAVDPGFDSRGVLLATISLPSASYKEPGQVAAFYDTLLARIRALPGVTAASAASGVPLYRDNGVWDFDIEGAPEPGPGQPAWNGAVLFPRPGFFEALQVPIVRGRTITDQDTASSQPVVLINEALARQFFDGAGPIGRRIRVSGGTPPNPWMTIAGIVGNVRDRSLHEPPRPMYFMPAAQAPVSTGGPARTMALVMRGASDPSSLAPALRSLVMTLDPALAVFRIAPYRGDRRRFCRAPAIHRQPARHLRAGRAAARRVGHLRRAGVLGFPADAGDRHSPCARRARRRRDALDRRSGAGAGGGRTGGGRGRRILAVARAWQLPRRSAVSGLADRRRHVSRRRPGSARDRVRRGAAAGPARARGRTAHGAPDDLHCPRGFAPRTPPHARSLAAPTEQMRARLGSGAWLASLRSLAP